MQHALFAKRLSERKALEPRNGAGPLEEYDSWAPSRGRPLNSAEPKTRHFWWCALSAFILPMHLGLTRSSLTTWAIFPENWKSSGSVCSRLKAQSELTLLPCKEYLQARVSVAWHRHCFSIRCRNLAQGQQLQTCGIPCRAERGHNIPHGSWQLTRPSPTPSAADWWPRPSFQQLVVRPGPQGEQG